MDLILEIFGGVIFGAFVTVLFIMIIVGRYTNGGPK